MSGLKSWLMSLRLAFETIGIAVNLSLTQLGFIAMPKKKGSIFRGIEMPQPIKTFLYYLCAIVRR